MVPVIQVRILAPVRMIAVLRPQQKKGSAQMAWTTIATLSSTALTW
jgi:hypothetical protein